MKKNVKIMMIALTMAFMMTGCKSNDYKTAQSLYDEGKYEEAITMYESLGDYKDSADLLVTSKYMMACDLQDEEKYDEAIAIYDEIGDYEQSASNKEKCNLAKASKLIEEKNYEEALAIVENYPDSEEGKHFADICKVHINGMDGLIEYMKENIEANSHGNNAKSVHTGKDNSVRALTYYEKSSNCLKIEVKSDKENTSGSSLTYTMTMSGKDQGNYKLIFDSLTKVNAAYAYYHDTILVGSNYYVGYVINAFGKVNLAKFQKDQKVKVDTFTVAKSSDDLDDAQLKKIAEAAMPSEVVLTLEGLQQFLNEQNLRTSLADLGIKKYKTIFCDDPYANPVTTSDYSADRTIAGQEVESKDDNKEAQDESNKDTETNSEKADNEGAISVQHSTGKAVFKGWEFAPDDFLVDEKYKDKKAIIVNFDYTNLEDKEKQFQNDFWIRLYQNGVELESDGTYHDENSPTVKNFFKSVIKDGNITIGKWAILEDDSPVTVMISNNGGSEEVSESMTIDIK